MTSTCTALETACSELLDDLLRLRASSTSSALESALIRRQKAEMNKSWVNRLTWLSTGFDLSLDSSLKEELLAMIELRNAIAHNGHSFTPRQTGQYETFLRLRQTLEASFGVVFRGTAFVVGVATGDAALRVGRDVVVQLLV